MRVDITGRHLDVTPALREFAEGKLRKVRRLLDAPMEAHVVLWIDKHRHVAEIQVKARGLTLTGTEETGDLYASIGEVADKLERQALKHKEKSHDHKHRRSQRDPEIAAVISANAAEAEREAAPQSNPTPRIVPSDAYQPKPMSPEDALIALEASEENIVVFREASTSRINVLFRRKDGNFGLIDPEA